MVDKEGLIKNLITSPVELLMVKVVDQLHLKVVVNRHKQEISRK
jgi:hypothetical protein